MLPFGTKDSLQGPKRHMRSVATKHGSFSTPVKKPAHAQDRRKQSLPDDRLCRTTGRAKGSASPLAAGGSREYASTGQIGSRSLEYAEFSGQADGGHASAPCRHGARYGGSPVLVRSADSGGLSSEASYNSGQYAAKSMASPVLRSRDPLLSGSLSSSKSQGSPALRGREPAYMNSGQNVARSPCSPILKGTEPLFIAGGYGRRTSSPVAATDVDGMVNGRETPIIGGQIHDSSGGSALHLVSNGVYHSTGQTDDDGYKCSAPVLVRRLPVDRQRTEASVAENSGTPYRQRAPLHVRSLSPCVAPITPVAVGSPGARLYVFMSWCAWACHISMRYVCRPYVGMHVYAC
jgi:hypothetical protein